MKACNTVARGAGRRWGKRVALRDIDLEFPAGQQIALLGPSGSGKTTLLRLLMAALRPTSGDILIDGISTADMSPAQVRKHRQRCGLVDQGLQVLPRLSVHDNVIAGRVPHWPWWKTLLSTLVAIDRQDVHALLQDVGLAQRQWDQADDLSGGQQQRVSIARALSACPTLLLADEPTAALDPTTASEVIQLLSREARKRDATLIISTHRVSQVIDNMDRVIGLRQAQVFFDEPAKKVDKALLDRLYAGSSERA